MIVAGLWIVLGAFVVCDGGYALYRTSRQHTERRPKDLTLYL